LRQNQAKSGEIRQLFDVGHEQIVAGYNSINRVRNDTLRARARAREKTKFSESLSLLFNAQFCGTWGTVFTLKRHKKENKKAKYFFVSMYE